MLILQNEIIIRKVISAASIRTRVLRRNFAGWLWVIYHTKAVLLGYSYAEESKVSAANCGFCTNTGEVYYDCNSDADLQGPI